MRWHDELCLSWYQAIVTVFASVGVRQTYTLPAVENMRNLLHLTRCRVASHSYRRFYVRGTT